MKSLFLKNRDACDWLAETVKNPFFELARVHAISELATQLPGEPGDENRMKGAVMAFQTIVTLAEKTQPKEKPVERLNYNA